MKKIIFANLDILCSEIHGLNLREYRDDFLRVAAELYAQGNTLIFESMHRDKLYMAKNVFKDVRFNYLKFWTRSDVKRYVMENKNMSNSFVFLSGTQQDFYIAVQSKSLFIVPTWIPAEQKTMLYGIRVDTPEQLLKFIKTLNNQNYWFSKINIEQNVTVLSLMDARYGYYADSMQERDMLIHFEELLKRGNNRNYYDILLNHFISGMTNTTFFDDIELFGMIPSSDCSMNNDMHLFMTQVRYIKGKRLPKNTMNCDNLLIRHKPKNKAHEIYSAYDRFKLGAKDEFDTMFINPEFESKINRLKKQNKFNVMIFDDYMTHGNTFNAVRNLLKNIGANKIIFVSLGSFNKPFQKKDYYIEGSVYDADYKASLTNEEELIHFEYQQQAKWEVAELYDIFNE